MKCMIIDFAKYKADREIDAFFADHDLSIYQFGCPDCGSSDFNIFLDMTAKCTGCDLEVLLTVGDDEL